jgi:hypothetical protein
MTFGETIAEAYAVEGTSVELGRGVHEGELGAEAVVRLPMRMLNRHGLIAGATGTGKTRTLQLIAEQLSAAGVAVFAADHKGDLSGMAEPGPADGPAEARMAELGLPFEPAAFPVDFLSLGGIGPGVPVRATVTDFGPQLLAKVLGANETQESSLALVFRFADERGLPLVDPADLRAFTPEDADVDGATRASPLYARYAKRVERESAHELLGRRVERAAERRREPTRRGRKPRPKPPSDPLSDFLGSRQGKRLQREVVRGVFGMLRKRL